MIIYTRSGHTVEVRRGEINVTSSRIPDINWKHKDSHGHFHFWWEQAESGEFIPAREYDPVKKYDVKSLLYVLDAEATDEYPEEGHYVCVQCGEAVTPRYTADDRERYVAGSITYYCDGERIDRETFDRLLPLI